MKSLKSAVFSTIWATALLLTTCSRDFEHIGICGSPSPQPPPGYQLTVVSDLDGSYFHMQFLDDLNGYLIGRNPRGGWAKIQKTTDGGQTWTELLAGNIYLPTSLAFRNSQEGLLSINDITGCPSACLRKTVVVRTIDGGATWTEITYPNLSGSLFNVQFDTQGTAYASLDGHSIMVSEDLGDSWQTLFTSQDMEMSGIRFIYEMFDDKLYVSAQNGDFIKIDKQGNLLQHIEPGENLILRLTVSDEENLIVEGMGRLLVSSDGGESWQELYPRNAAVLDWTASGEGLAILNKSYCDGTLSQLDAFGVTADGGQTWTFSGDSGNLASYFGDSQRMSDGSTLLLIDNQLLRLRKQ